MLDMMNEKLTEKTIILVLTYFSDSPDTVISLKILSREKNILVVYKS